MDWSIENQFLKVTVTSCGAQVKSALCKLDDVEHMWGADPSVWRFHSPILFPYTGRIRDGRINIRGKTVEDAPIHGLVRTKEFHVVEHEATRLTLAVDSDDETLRVFPYRFRLSAAFSLDGCSLLCSLTVENRDEAPFSFGIGYHPGFAVPFDDRHRLEDYELRFSEWESPICLDTPEGLLNGTFRVPNKNIRSTPISDGMFDAGSRCMTGLRSKTLGLYEKDSHRAVICDIGAFPYCLIWGTEGTPRFVCIEPWHSLPDAESDSGLWEEKAAAATVLPGEHWSTTLKTTFAR